MIIRKSPFLIYQAIFFVFYLALNVAYAQKSQGKSKSVDEYLSKLLAELKLDEKMPQKYHITSYWHNRDISPETRQAGFV